MPLVHTIKSEIMHPAQHTCYMALHAQNPTPATGDHWAVIDSGTSKHVLLEHIYLANATEDHTAVAGFSGQTSRATHRGDFTATVRTATGKLIHITDVDSALVIPDAIRTLYSVRKSLQSGNTIRFDANAGLLVQGRPEFSSRSSETPLQISSYFHYSCHLHDTTEYMASTMLPQRTRIQAASTFSSKLRQPLKNPAPNSNT